MDKQQEYLNIFKNLAGAHPNMDCSEKAEIVSQQIGCDVVTFISLSKEGMLIEFTIPNSPHESFCYHTVAYDRTNNLVIDVSGDYIICLPLPQYIMFLETSGLINIIMLYCDYSNRILYAPKMYCREYIKDTCKLIKMEEVLDMVEVYEA